MKIEGNRPNLESIAAQRLERSLSDVRGGRTGAGTAAGGDSVNVSADASLAAHAVSAVGTAPAIRTDLVEAMRAKLADGTLGNDAGALADAMLGRLTEK